MPEIYDATVVIKGAVREAGDRAKVAVYSRERDVDPVGACVGMKGTRVQAIIRELRGEKIDIVEWSEDPVAFVTNALSPAKVQRVSIVDDHERVMEVVVEDKQLSLAIGKKGQNVRLAAKLTGWRIDIKSEEEKRKEVEAQMSQVMIQTSTPLRERARSGRGRLEKLVAAGITTVEQVADMTPEHWKRFPASVPRRWTDYFGISFLELLHGVAADPAQAAGLALAARRRRRAAHRTVLRGATRQRGRTRGGGRGARRPGRAQGLAAKMRTGHARPVLGPGPGRRGRG